ncbi:MAG TPA: hypothetical protein VMV69_04860 [Pirellulales bacterium]|nr:hypothetical protein [Pirellulales bacterium]
MEHDDAALVAKHTAKRGAIYRELSFRTITLEAWREIVEVAYEEALLGDDRARIWIQRTIGLADAARVERAVRAVASHVVYTDMLRAVAAARAERARGGDVAAPDAAPSAPATTPAEAPSYWSVVFDVVTPGAWQRLVEAAMCQARSGDPRAREWIASVLGADSAIDELGRADAAAGYVTISTLKGALERGGRGSDIPPYSQY